MKNRKKTLNYGKHWINENDINEVIKVLKSDFISQGPRIESFEREICKFTGAKYCVAVSSGTAALHIAIACLSIDKGKKGITSPLTFLASSNSMLYNGLIPVFVDIDPDYYVIDPVEIEKKLSKDVNLIMPVHFSGHPCDMENIFRLVNKTEKYRDVYIIEDAAHALGSKYPDGSYVGNCKHSDLTIFSFHPVKVITTGEGGAVTTNNEKLYRRLLMLRNHGIVKDSKKNAEIGPWFNEMIVLGFNYKLSDIHASLGITQMNRINSFIKRRREIADRYNLIFKNKIYLKIPLVKKNNFSSYHIYVLLIDFEKIKKSRKTVMNALKKKSINTQVHYIPVHTQPYYIRRFDYKWGDFPIVEDYYKKALTIPLHPKMTNGDVDYVIKTLLEILEE